MNTRCPLTVLFLFLLVFISEGQAPTNTTAYQESLEQWQSELSESRKGYLQLAALCKLNEDVTTTGSADSCNCTIAIEEIPGLIGSFAITDGHLYFRTSEGDELTYDGDQVRSSIEIEVNKNGDSKLFKLGRLTWKIITRGDRYYIRAYDARHPAVDAFKGFKRFPVNDEFIYNAEFRYFKSPLSSNVDSRLGITQQWEFIGQLSFAHQGKVYTLDVSNHGFTMVRDLTSGESTYGGGRYIYIDLPDSDGTVLLDFNRLYNPPCAFSEYTTCLLPPLQNTLDFEVTAGETITALE